ncbi:MAG TPA: glycosyl hydrolase [Fibrobacteria bacterium]|nr:glycosyl hydrolase [Fibrobacteria bacterium]
MIEIKNSLKPQDLSAKLDRLWAASAEKIESIEKTWDPAQGSPVFTVKGKYTSKGWTEWTQGFVYGSAILQYDATGDAAFLEIGRGHTFKDMAGHITHTGVHDHGFNNVSTYGNLWRLIVEGRIQADGREKDFYELALKCSGAVQAMRWTPINNGRGFIHSFNGPHSLFADTIRSLRALALSHKLGHTLLGEKDAKINLLGRLVDHAAVTAEFTLFYGEGRDSYDVPALRGRAAHEILFNTNDGSYRCPNSQQGYAPFTTWTRGLAWVMLGYAEELEFLATLSDKDLDAVGGRKAVEAMMLKAARASCDFYIAQTPRDGIPYWDTGAPNLHKLGNYLDKPADPFNEHEPVDSSAAAIACQGLLRLGRLLRARGETAAGDRYWQAGLTVVDRLFEEPYLSTDPAHQGLLLHNVYHRPNGWDYVPPGAKVPLGESSQWGDYHAREAALYLQRIIKNGKYYAFYGA